MTRYSPSRVACIVSIACLLATLFQVYIGFQAGGLPPEVILYGALTLIFSALWRTLSYS